MPELPVERRRLLRGRHSHSVLATVLLAAVLGLAAPWHRILDEPALLSPLAAAKAEAKAVPSTCEDVQEEGYNKVSTRMTRWEKAAMEGNTIRNFGSQASRLLNRTLDSFDQSVRQHLGEDVQCKDGRQALERYMKEQLESIFLVQRSTIEQALYQRLKRELLQRMRRKKRELDVKEKLKLMHSMMNEYDSQVRYLQPFFVQNSERERAEQRLSELQWGIANTDEAKEMQKRWKMERMMRTPMRQSKGPSISLSYGMRLMFRPGGLGNLQINSRRQVGPPHNPNEIAVGVLNDGDVIDVYNKQARPPMIKFQPTVGVDVSAG
mmetsp:Transcript_28047/g.75933  ORF Transcript_28047/g.75933 Transcript_28047/m.75933 type:complete len:322 (-) Transcript_28047:75-1040(-)